MIETGKNKRENSTGILLRGPVGMSRAERIAPVF